MSESTSYAAYVIVQFLKMIIDINLVCNSGELNSRVQGYIVQIFKIIALYKCLCFTFARLAYNVKDLIEQVHLNLSRVQRLR